MDSMLLSFLINIAIGIALGRLFLWFVAKRLEAKLDAELNTLVDRIIEDLLVLVTVEVDGNQYLCYNSKTKDFVCQGIDIGEISKNFATRFPGKKMAIFDGDQTAIETLKKQLEETKHENSSSIGSTP